jgi:hypothetical protein
MQSPRSDRRWTVAERSSAGWRQSLRPVRAAGRRAGFGRATPKWNALLLLTYLLALLLLAGLLVR